MRNCHTIISNRIPVSSYGHHIKIIESINQEVSYKDKLLLYRMNEISAFAIWLDFPFKISSNMIFVLSDIDFPTHN